jgi:hypothetical protein
MRPSAPMTLKTENVDGTHWETRDVHGAGGNATAASKSIGRAVIQNHTIQKQAPGTTRMATEDD